MGWMHWGIRFQQAGGRAFIFMGRAARLTGALLLALFATTAPAQAAVESVPASVKWCSFDYANSLDVRCIYNSDLVAAQVTANLFGFTVLNCDSSYCNIIYRSGETRILGVQWIAVCPIPNVNPITNPYYYNSDTSMCERTVQETCPIADLPPITDTDPQVQSFENNPNISDTAHLTPHMQTALSCLQTAAAAGSPAVGSAYRPPAYNQHLIDVWGKWRELRRDTNPACTNLKAKIQQHFQRHGLLVSQPPVLNSLHTQGLAVDVTINLPSANIDVLARGCGLRRPLPIQDRVHFQFP